MEPTARKRYGITAAALLLAAALAFAACGSDSDDLDPGNAAEAPDYSKALKAAPPELADLYAEGGVVLESGLEGFSSQLAALEGYPVIVNKWASWCGPCRAEFPHLQNQAAKHADEVAFIGVDSDDSLDAASTFLGTHPVPYPSYFDPELEIAREINAAIEFPATVFFDRSGEIVYTRRGVYASEQELAADIKRYALDGRGDA